MKKLLIFIKGKIGFFAAIVFAAAIGGAMTTVVKASIPDGSGIVHGCYSTARGSLYIIDSSSASCATGETELTWDEHASTGTKYGDFIPSSFAGAGANGIDLSFRNLPSTNFTNTDLSGASLTKSNLSNSNFTGATLNTNSDHVNFTGANFHGTDIDSASFTASNFTNADMSDLTVSSGNFTGSNFTTTDFTNSNFVHVNLNDSTGLNTATMSGVTWSDVSCPDHTNSDDHSSTCLGHLTP